MDILERYHLALSYKEKSERELAKWLLVRDSKQIDLSQFDLVRDRYQRHVKRAQELTDTIRAGQEGSIPHLEEEIHALTRSRNKLIEAASSGSIKPKDVNKRSRAITDELEPLEAALGRAKLIVEATSTDILGSPIDLSFDDFLEQLDLIDEVEVVAPEKEPPSFSLRNVVILVTIGAVAWWGWLYYQSLGHVSWSTKVVDNKQSVEIVVRNTGKKSVRIHIPWEDGNTQVDMVQQLRPTNLGLLLYVQEKGKSDFQLLPETPDLWRVNGDEHSSGSTIGLRPGQATIIAFDTLGLRETGLSIDSIRIDLTRHGGRRLKKYQTTLP